MQDAADARTRAPVHDEAHPPGRARGPTPAEARSRRSHYHRSLRPWRTALGATVLALPLALGGAHVAVNLALAALMCGLLAWLAWRGGPSALRVSVHLPHATLLLALGWTLAQMAPLPLVVLRVISPRAYDLATLDRATTAWAALSLDVPTTAHEALKLVAYVAAALVAGAAFAHAGRERVLFGWLSGAGAAVTALGLLHALAGLKQPYGVFGPPGTALVSSFINANHLAGFLGMSSLVALGLALESRGVRRAYRLGAAALSGAGVLLSLSRGGILAYAFGLACLATLVLWARRHKQAPKARALMWLQGTLAATLLFAGYVAYGAIVHELWTLGTPEALAKAAVWRHVPDMLRDFAVSGVGRGAFGIMHAMYLPEGLNATLSHLENEPLQALVDFGPVIGLLVLGGMAASFVQAMRRAHGSTAHLGAASALVFLSLHNLVDFNLTLTSIALPAALLLVLLVAPAVASEAPLPVRPDVPVPAHGVPALRRVASELDRRALKVVAVALTSVTLGLAYPAVAHTLARDGTQVQQMVSDHNRSAAEVERDALPLVKRHPADYLMPLLIGERLLGTYDGARAALPWINRGLYLGPGFALGHKLAARALWQLGAKDQALLEDRLACAKAPNVASAVVEEVWQRTHSPAAIARLATGLGTTSDYAAQLLVREHFFDDAKAFIEAQSDNGQHAASLALAAVYVRALLGEGDDRGAAAHAAAMIERWPKEAPGYLLLAETYDKQGNRREAERALAQGLTAGGAVVPLLTARAELLLRGDDLGHARQAATELLGESRDGAQHAYAQYLLGRAYQADGRIATALRHYEKARDAQPGHLGYRLTVAQVREALGDLRGAQGELERARLEIGPTDELERAIDRLAKRNAAAREADKRRALIGR